jgi:hypothetical protein
LWQVKGQKNINGQSDVFAIQLSSDQVFSNWEFNQSGAFDLSLSSNQGFWDRNSSQSDDRFALYNSGKAAVPHSSARSITCTLSLLAYNLTMRVAQT